MAIWADFDMQRATPYGTPQEIREEVRRLMNTYFRPDGRFMLTFGNAITPDTPVASLDAVYDEAFRLGTELVSEIKPALP